jgi:hypothetical protein
MMTLEEKPIKKIESIGLAYQTCNLGHEMKIIQ